MGMMMRIVLVAMVMMKTKNICLGCDWKEFSWWLCLHTVIIPATQGCRQEYLELDANLRKISKTSSLKQNKDKRTRSITQLPKCLPSKHFEALGSIPNHEKKILLISDHLIKKLKLLLGELKSWIELVSREKWLATVLMYQPNENR